MLTQNRVWRYGDQYYAMEGRRVKGEHQASRFVSYHLTKPFLKGSMPTTYLFSDEAKQEWKTIEHYVVANRYTDPNVQEYIRKLKDLTALKEFVLAVEHKKLPTKSSKSFLKHVEEAKNAVKKNPDNNTALLKALFFYLKKCKENPSGTSVTDFGNDVVVYIDSEVDSEKSLDLFFGKNAEADNHLGIALMNLYQHLEINPDALNTDSVSDQLTLETSLIAHPASNFEFYRIGNVQEPAEQLSFLKASLKEIIEDYTSKIEAKSKLSALFSAQGKSGLQRASNLKNDILGANSILYVFKLLRDHFDRREFIRPGVLLGNITGRVTDDSLDTQLLRTLEACAFSGIDIPGGDALCSAKFDRAKKRQHFIDGVSLLEEALALKQTINEM